MAEVLTLSAAHDRALHRWIIADRAMLALGDEVAHHPALHLIGDMPLPQALDKIARYVGATVSMDEPAVLVFTKLTQALKDKRQ